jgi:hypothetical protein
LIAVESIINPRGEAEETWMAQCGPVRIKTNEGKIETPRNGKPDARNM